jgi:hypothetical protein
MVSCARATRGLRRMGRVAWPSSCSRNAHDKNVLVRRAQSRIDDATLENEMGNWEDARSCEAFGRLCLFSSIEARHHSTQAQYNSQKSQNYNR